MFEVVFEVEVCSADICPNPSCSGVSKVLRLLTGSLVGRVSSGVVDSATVPVPIVGD